MKLTKNEFEDMLDHLMEIEIKSVGDVVKDANKEGKEEHLMMGHAYLKGLRRAREIIHVVLKDVE